MAPFTFTGKQSLSHGVATAILVICGGIVAAIMWFGNPGAWMTDAQYAQYYQSGIDYKTSHGEAVLGNYCAISNTDDADRNTNLKLAADALNGKVVKSGESFSFNDAVGDTAQNDQYKNAAVIKAGNITKERGGGVCQVSSALYLAALKAGLTVTDRSAHTLAIDYAPLGLDATVDYGTTDLVFTNNTNADITLYVAAQGPTVTASIVGTAVDSGITYDAFSEVTQSYSKGTGTDQVMYYVVSSYRVKYKNGIQVSKDMIAVDTYQSSNVEFSVSPMPTDGSSK